MKIIWTKHASNRQILWEEKKGITQKEVEKVLEQPEQVVEDDLDVYIAQSRRENGLLRVAFKKIDNGIKIITLYWTSKFEKYWKEE